MLDQWVPVVTRHHAAGGVIKAQFMSQELLLKLNFKSLMPLCMWHFTCSRVKGNSIGITIMHETALITCRPRVKGYRPVSRAARVGVQMGWTYDCSSVTPPFASSSKCGVSTVGLCQETSCHPEIGRNKQRGSQWECGLMLKFGSKLLGFLFNL